MFLCNTCSLFLAALALNPSSGNPNYPTLNNYFQFLAEAIANKKENFEVQKPDILKINVRRRFTSEKGETFSYCGLYQKLVVGTKPVVQVQVQIQLQIIKVII